MKKIKSILVMSCAVMAFVSCSKDDETNQTKPEANKITPEILAKISALSFNNKDDIVFNFNNSIVLSIPVRLWM